MTTNTNNTAPPAALPFHLTGNFAPVTEELTIEELTVTGTLPAELNGVYLRNGPNPRNGPTPIWFLGQGMLHGVRLEAGKAAWYRNRWVDAASTSNTHIVRHAGKLMALVETALPVLMDEQLATIGPTDFDGALTRGITAHPKICPLTGELIFFSYSPQAPFLMAYRADAGGRVIQSEAIDVASATYMHDFAITPRFTLFFDLPVLFKGWREPMPIQWSEEYGARIGVLPRSGKGEEIRWFTIANCNISHTVNAFESGNTVIVDVARGANMSSPTALYRYVLDLGTGAVTEQALAPLYVDFPRIDERRTGLPYRYAYGLEMCDMENGAPSRSVLRKFDLHSGSSLVHDLGPGRSSGEAVFIPRAGSQAEDDGYAMSLVYDRERNTSELLVLDAANFDAPALATVALPCRVPFGFHGDWFADRVG